MKKPIRIDIISQVGLTALDSDSQILRKTSKVAIRKMEEYYDPLLTEALEALRAMVDTFCLWREEAHLSEEVAIMDKAKSILAQSKPEPPGP